MNANSDECVTVTPYPNGPLIVRGDFELVDVQGRPLPRQRRTIALCRCGASTLKPYCDGSHRAMGFSDAPPPAAL